MNNYSNNMTLTEISNYLCAISNSYYNLRKKGLMNHISEEEYKKTYEELYALSRKIDWEVVYRKMKEA